LAGAYVISNRATRINQSASERSEITNRLQAQLELIKAHQETNAPEWNDIKAKATAALAGPDMRCDATGIQSTEEKTGSSPPDHFHIENDGTIVDSKLVVNGIFTIWLEGFENVANSTYDYYAHGCWQDFVTKTYNHTGLVLRLEEGFE